MENLIALFPSAHKIFYQLGSSLFLISGERKKTEIPSHSVKEVCQECTTHTPLCHDRHTLLPSVAALSSHRESTMKAAFKDRA